MIAEVTYNVGASCMIGSMKFKQNVSRVVTDEDVIKRAQATAGFSVVIREEAKPEKIVRKVEKPAKAAEPVAETEDAPKKKSKKRSFFNSDE